MLKRFLSDSFKESVRSSIEFKKIYNELLAHDHYDHHKLRETQNHMLKKLIEFSYNKNEYYKKLFDECGLSYSDINTKEDLLKIPTLNKEIVRSNYKELISKKLMLSGTAYTSGTTGTPLRLKRSYFSINYENANIHRLLKWANYEKGDVIAVVRGDKFKSGYYYFNNINKKLYISSFDLSNNLAEVYNLLNKHNVKYLYSYPSSAEMISSYIINNDKAPITFKGVITSSEMIMSTLREKVRIAFQCKVFDYYGQAERTCMIMNCEDEEYHLMTDYGAEYLKHVEGNIYEIISTNLFNYAMPLINYETGDLVEIEDSNSICNKKYPVVKNILGRKSHFIIVNGNKIYSAALTHIFYELNDNNIVQSQFVQNSYNSIILKVILNDNNKKTISKLYENLEKYLGKNNIKIEVTNSLEKSNSGKLNFIENRIKNCL